MSENIDTITANWGLEEGFASVFSQGQQQFFKWPEQRDRLEAHFANQASRNDAYISWCLFDQSGRRVNDASIVPGILIDLDLATGKHAKSDYPPNSVEALAEVRKTALPEPSRILSSGGGLYLHYLFDKPFVIRSDDDRRRAIAVLKGVTSMLGSAMAARGWSLDDVSDLARITRPAGVRNWKYQDDERHVELVSEAAERLSISEYEALVGTGIRKGPLDRPGSSVVSGDESGVAQFRLIERYCGFVRGLSEKPHDVSEPEWYATATLAAHCVDGAERFHEISALDETRYDQAETDAKLSHARGIRPRTCDDIANSLGCKECARCPFRAADMKSPYKLAFGDAELLDLQSRYILAAQTDQYLPTSRSEMPLQASSFTNHFAHRVPKAHSLFVHDPRSPKVMATDYLPGDERLIVPRPDGTSILNEWVSAGTEPIAGETDIVDGHFKFLLPDERERNWLLDYMAHLLQRPGIKIRHGIMLIGEPGVGKSFINDLLKSLFGEPNVKIDDAGMHASDYRRSLGNVQVLVIEEMATSAKWEVTNSLKPWFTSDTVVANEKYIRAHEVRAPRGIFIHTNHAVPAVFEKGERRNAVFRIDAAPNDRSYYDRLFTAGLGQFAAFKHSLWARDLSHWSPNRPPPISSAKAEIIEASRTPVAAEIEDLINEERIPRDLVTVREIAGLLANAIYSSPPPSNGKVLKALHEIGARKLDKTKLSDGSAVTLWAVRNEQRWLGATHAERKAHYEGRIGSSGLVLGVLDEIGQEARR